ncbi:UbiA family prenyltransferase [Microbacterium sp. Marseille-Q6648]|uniref:UbiA family prenyltransferase n=1 Tax=Microbacterium sp. Marseille-Q6648 TaxID=2937991 RepID=UPI0020422043|nr:UbiA family prenyltransferase [Microbacterium sp. Marseille-Q6648]
MNRTWARVAGALWASTHPGPTLVVTGLSFTLGIAVGLEPWRLAVLALAVFAGQVSVGISNDAIDVARDRAVGRTDKPLARGDASVRSAWVAAGAAAGVALLLSALLGVGMLLAHALALASAWAYNAGLKATVWSVVPFLVSFGLLPPLATLSAPSPAMAPLWASAAGAALGAAVHLTNVLPDLADDARTGIRGLPHRLGARVSAAVAVVAIMTGAVAVLVGPDPGAPSAVAWVFFVAVAAVAAAALVLALVRPPSRALFRLAMLAALLLATQLVLTSARIT